VCGRYRKHIGEKRAAQGRWIQVESPAEDLVEIR